MKKLEILLSKIKLHWKTLVLEGLLLIFLTGGQSFSQVTAAELDIRQDEQKILMKNIKKLNERKAKYRLEAIEQLRKVKEKDDKENVGKALCNRLKKEKDVRVKEYLIEALVTIRNKEAGKAIVDALKKEKNKDLRLQMINALGNLKDKGTVSILKESLKGEEKTEKFYAASSLAMMKDGSGIDVLEKIVLDKKEKRGRRSFAVRSLGEIKDEKVVNILKKLLEEEDFALRLQAVASLGEIGTKEAIELVRQMRTDSHERVRSLAGNILRRFK